MRRRRTRRRPGYRPTTCCSRAEPTTRSRQHLRGNVARAMLPRCLSRSRRSGREFLLSTAPCIPPMVTATEQTTLDYRAACVQFDVRPGDVAANVAAMRTGVEEAVAAGAALCVLPELWSTSFLS